MAKRIINATGPQTSFNYGVNGARLYFNFYVEYEEPSGAGTINPSTLNTTLVYQRPGPLNTIQYVESARLQADGTWKALRENEARVINPPSPGSPNGSIGNVVNQNSTNYVLGESARRELVAKGPNTLNYAARQNAMAVVDKSTSLTLDQINQAYYISQSTKPGGTQVPPVLPLNPAAAPAAAAAAAATVTATSDVTLSVTENKPAFAKDKQILKYPLEHTGQNYDYIKITPMKYEPGLDFQNINPKNDFSFERIQNRITTPSGSTIFLPMVPGITESNSVGWGEDSLNPIQIEFGQAAGNIIRDPGTSFTLKGALDNITDLMNTARDFIYKPGLQSAITAMFAGQAVGANFLGRSGIVINPNLELLFTGPKLRTFSYNFKFTPRSRDEAVEIRTIIKVLKKSMAVGHTPGELFLQVPSVFDIKYIYYGGDEGGGKEHPFMNKIKPCALTGLNVDYTPDGSYMTYGSNNTEDPNSKGSGSMTSYGLSLQFSELEPIYNEDLGDVDDPTMGY